MSDLGFIRPYRPMPKDFEETFIRVGWEGIGAEYRAHTRTICRWIKECGEDRLREAREVYLRKTRWPNGVPGNRRKRYVLGKTLRKIEG